MKTHLTPVLASILIVGCAEMSRDHDDAATVATGPTNTVVSVSDVEWEQLNPARGDQSPRAGTLWGDRQGTVPTGFLAEFVDGFSSPPHIHNATYRAVVISGHIHNDDPEAEKMWMPAGSFWTQPKGEIHITAAKGAYNLALVEIDMGPYLVLPTTEAFDSGERPINIDMSNIVWVRANDEDAYPNAPEIAYLWGNERDGQSRGRFVKLARGFVGEIHAYGASFRAVLIKGQLQHSGEAEERLEPGSYFSSNDDFRHQLAAPESEVIIYIRTDGEFEIKTRAW